MRRLAGLPCTLLAATLLGQGCKSERPPAPQSEASALSAGGNTASGSTASSPVAPAPAESPRLVFQVSARYPASVAYALDQAAASRVPDPRYREWLFGKAPGALPQWFEAYAAERSSWQTSRRGPDGPYDAYAACGYLADTLPALLECAKAVLSPGELAVAQAALEQTDVLLRPHWTALEPVIQRWQSELAAITGGPQGRELARLLARSAQLPEDEQLTFEVVLVAKPRHNTSRARQAGSHLVLEVSDERQPLHQAHVLFHEIAHLAAKHAPGRGALEAAFAGRGAAGLVASNLWNEAFATAFGNGLAAEQLDPRFSPERSFYEDEAIDALGRALYRRWRAGAQVTLDASLAEHLVQLIASDWPRERWRLGDVTRSLVAFSDDPQAAELLRESLRPYSLYTYEPVPDDLGLSPEVSQPVARLVVATVATLRQRPDVLELFGEPWPSVRRRVSAEGASVLWRDGGAAVSMLLTAGTRAALRDAIRALSELPAVPADGWTALRARATPADRAP